MTECGSCPAFGYQCEDIAKLQAQKAEIEKLREALQDMVDMRELHLGSCVHPKGELQIVANARAALGETK